MTSISKKRIFISACEPSAEAHCANLINRVNDIQTGRFCPDEIKPTVEKPDAVEYEWVGLGGPIMEQAGCSLIENMVNRAAMIYNVFGQIGYYLRIIREVKRYFNENKIDLLIVCDSPAFNFHIAKIAKKHHVPVLFYVAPQLWAWAPWRIHKLRKCCTKLACILPFEKDWFARRGVDVEYVCNPLFDTLDTDVKIHYKDYSGYDPDAPKIALMPGSRDAEINTLWPAMQRVAIELQKSHPNAMFTVAAANQEKLEILKQSQRPGLTVNYQLSKVTDLSRQSDLVLVASGSATLQVAAGGCPMVIMYQSNRFLWQLIGRWLIRTRFLSLVNILAGRELVPEFMPYFTSIDPIVQKTDSLLRNKLQLTQASQALIDLIEPLTRHKATDKVAEMTVNMLTKTD